MVRSSFKERAGALALVLVQLGIPVFPAFADDAAPVQGVMSGMNTSPSAQFDAARQAAMGSLFSTCQGSTLANAAGAVASCFAAPPGDLKDLTAKLECSTFSAGGGFSPEMLATRRKAFSNMEAGIACQKSKLDSARGQLQCLSEQAAALSATIGAVASEYQQNLARFQGEISQINSQTVDRKEQQKEVIARLGGDGETGDDGLLGAKKETEALIAQMPKEILAFRNANKQLDSQRKSFEEQVKFRTVSLARECFENKAGDYRCKPNGPPVKYKEHLLCIYEQQQYVRAGGVVEDNKLTQAQAAGKRAALEALLNELFSEAPTSKDVPASAEAAQQALTQNTNVMTYEDIASRYGSKLAGFGVKDKVLGRISGCFDQSKSTVSRERTMESTQLGRVREQLLAAERTNQATAKETFQRYNQAYSRGMYALTGENYPLVLTACESAKPGTQEACMEDIQRNMQGMLMGNSAASEMLMSIKSSQPKNFISFKCQGINGCISKLRNINTNLKKEVVNLKSFKRDYVTKANQSMDQAAQRMAQALAPQNQMLEKQIRDINSALSGFGVKGVVTPKGVEAEQLEKDGEFGGDSDSDMGGLYKMPKSLTNFIGGKMSPPMLDVSKDSFKDALGGIVEASNKLDDKKSKIADVLSTLDGLASSCPAAAMESAISKLDSEVRKMESCYGNKAWCDKNSSALDSLLASMTNIGAEGLESVQASLDSGINACKGAKVEGTSFCDVSRAQSKLDEVRRIQKRNERSSKSSGAL